MSEEHNLCYSFVIYDQRQLSPLNTVRIITLPSKNNNPFRFPLSHMNTAKRNQEDTHLRGTT